MLHDLILNNRSYRRFDEKLEIPLTDLKELVNLARLSPSARNLQPLKYFLANTPKINNTIFKSLAWAGYIENWEGPEPGERPSAYIILLNDNTITENMKWDDGIVAQSIMLGAVEKGYGGCMIGSVKRKELRDNLHIPPHLDIILVLALGKPIEKVQIEEMKYNDHKYWRDKEDVHHVPKRNLDDIIIS